MNNSYTSLGINITGNISGLQSEVRKIPDIIKDALNKSKESVKNSNAVSEFVKPFEDAFKKIGQEFGKDGAFHSIYAGLRKEMESVAHVTDQFVGSFSKVSSSGLTTTMQAGFTTIAAVAVKATTAIAGVVSIAAAAGAALYAVGKPAIDFADNMGKAAEAAGIAVEDYSGLSHAANLAGASQSELSSILKSLSNHAADAAKGTGQAYVAFTRLGVSVLDSNGKLRDTKSLLFELADKFAGLPAGIEKNALMMDVFGSRGGESLIKLNQLLKGGADGLREAADEAKRFGLIVSNDAAKAAAEFNDNITKLKAAFNGLMITVGNYVIPVLVRFLDLLGKITGVELEGTQARMLDRAVDAADKKIAAMQERLGRMRGDASKFERELKEQQIAAAKVERNDLAEQRDRLRAGPNLPRTELQPPELKSHKEATAARSRADHSAENFTKALARENEKLQEQVIKIKQGDYALAEHEIRTKFLEAAKLGLTKTLAKELALYAELTRAIPKLKKEMKEIEEFTKRQDQDMAESANISQDFYDKVQKSALASVKSMKDALATPAEKFSDSLKKLDELRRNSQGFGEDSMSAETYARELKRITEELTGVGPKPFESFNRTIESLNKLFAEGAIDAKVYGEALKKAQDDLIAADPELNKVMSNIEDFARRAVGSMTSAFENLGSGAKSVGQTFKEMALDMIKSIRDIIIQVMILEPLIEKLRDAMRGYVGATPAQGKGVSGLGGGFGNLLGGLFGGGASVGYGSRPAGVEGPLMANGGFFSNPLSSAWSWVSGLFGGFLGGAKGGLFPSMNYAFSNGGIATRPGYSANSMGGVNVFGEKAPQQYEAIVPLPDNRSIPVTLKGGMGMNSSSQSNGPPVFVLNFKRAFVEDYKTTNDEIVEAVYEDNGRGGRIRTMQHEFSQR